MTLQKLGGAVFARLTQLPVSMRWLFTKGTNTQDIVSSLNSLQFRNVFMTIRLQPRILFRNNGTTLTKRLFSMTHLLSNKKNSKLRNQLYLNMKRVTPTSSSYSWRIRNQSSSTMIKQNIVRPNLRLEIISYLSRIFRVNWKVCSLLLQ